MKVIARRMLDSPESAVDDPQVSDTASSGSVASLGLGTPVIYTGKNDELVRINEEQNCVLSKPPSVRTSLISSLFFLT